MARPARVALLILLAQLLIGSRCLVTFDDRDALQDLIDASGPGALVRFPPGVYTLCKALVPLPGQTWDLAHAVLKRCDAVVSRLVADAPAGSTLVQVEDPTRFEVGQRVTPVKGPDRMGGERQPLHVIQRILGNTIVFTNPLTQDYRAGDLFLVIEPIVSAKHGPVDGFTMRGGLIDGNRRRNPHFVAWEVAWSVGIAGRGVSIEDVDFYDCWGDCLKSVGPSLQDSVVRRTRFLRGSTAGIHLTGANGLLIEGSVFRELNRDALMAGHSEGAVTWSAHNRDITIRDSCFQDIPASQAKGALADTNLYWNREIYVHDNQFCQVPAIWRGYLAAEPLPEYQPTGVVEIVGNHAINAGLSTVRASSSVASPVVGIVFSRNFLVNSGYDWSDASKRQVVDNVQLSFPAQCSCDAWLAGGG